jgi:hypothetical protein
VAEREVSQRRYLSKCRSAKITLPHGGFEMYKRDNLYEHAQEN